jgi:hypothetical protein
MANRQESAGAVSALADYTSVGDWQDRYAGPFFETRSALDWFIRHHRAELIELGALIPRSGRNGSLVSKEKFPKAVLSILKREAQEKTRAAAPSRCEQASGS